VEQTQYQTLVHLSLKLRQGTDEQVKRYLAARLKDTQETLLERERGFLALEEAHTKASQTNE
jgi:hypothetical protein